MYACFYIIAGFACVCLCSVIGICHFNIYMTDVGVMHEAGYVFFSLSGAPGTTSHLDYYILSIFHYFGSPLSTLIFDLMRNLHINNAYINIYSITFRLFASGEDLLNSR